MRALLRQPLLHFLAAGALIFLAYSWLGPDNGTVTNEREIRVDRDALLNFMQYRAQAFDRDLFAQRFDALDDDQRQALIQQYVLEETLYREAVSLGLDDGDYDIRQRLVQKMSFLVEDVAAGEAEQIEPGDDELRLYYEQHAEDYRVDPDYTFAHVFFDKDKHGEPEAHALAEALLPKLQDGNVSADATADYGDRFRYLRKYEARNRTQVINNFGQDFVDELDRLPVDHPAWSGPFASRLGWHLVLLSARTDSRLPALAEIRDKVLYDYRYEKMSAAVQDAEDELVKKYDVVVELP